MEIKVEVTRVEKPRGTVEWLKAELEEGNIRLTESNNHYIPAYDPHNGGEQIQTHSLVIYEPGECGLKENEAVICWKNFYGEYETNIDAALGVDEHSHWALGLDKEAKQALTTICEQWVKLVTDRGEPETPTIDVTIN